MAFNLNGFMKTEYQQRTADIIITNPLLIEQCDNKENPIWKVRGLSSIEIAIAKESGQKNKSISDVLSVLTNSHEKIEELKKLIGVVNEDIPNDIKERLEYLVIGSIDPVIDMSLAIKLSEFFVLDFMVLTNKIRDLTGEGCEIKK